MRRAPPPCRTPPRPRCPPVPRRISPTPPEARAAPPIRPPSRKRVYARARPAPPVLPTRPNCPMPNCPTSPNCLLFRTVRAGRTVCTVRRVRRQGNRSGRQRNVAFADGTPVRRRRKTRKSPDRAQRAAKAFRIFYPSSSSRPKKSARGKATERGGSVPVLSFCCFIITQPPDLSMQGGQVPEKNPHPKRHGLCRCFIVFLPPFILPLPRPRQTGAFPCLP